MRTHIAKSLQRRCKAIQRAVKVYNSAALALDPPRPTVDWSKVSHYSFLDEFVLLQDTRQDISDRRWSKPAVRATIKQWLRVLRAREEISRCNVEVRRLHTAIVDEEQHSDAVLAALDQEPRAIGGAIREYVTRRYRVNNHILACLQKVFGLDGFTGDKTVGKRKGGALYHLSGSGMGEASNSLPAGVQEAMAEMERESDEEIDEQAGRDDEAEGDIGGLIDYVSALPVSDKLP